MATPRPCPPRVSRSAAAAPAGGLSATAGRALRTTMGRLKPVVTSRPAWIGTAGIVLVAVFSLAMLGRTPGPEPEAAGPLVQSGPVEQPVPLAPELPGPPGSAAEDALPVPAPVAEPEPSWHYVQVARGETLERIFRRMDLSPRLLHEVVNLDEATARLARIRPGDEFAFDIDPEAGFRALRAELDDENWLYVERTGEALTSRTEPRNLEVRIVEAAGEIRSSLFNAAHAAGLADNLTMRLANIFGWDIDFALDIRAGDSFSLIFEEVYRDGEFLRQGNILAARFVNQGQSFEAVRFDAGNGPDYFAPDGRPMRKAFLRAPLNFTRVTSNFNPRRFHPITRRVRPHNGTDYGAPTGTPVWAAGDGTVIESGYGSANGNYVFIQHGNHIVTRYLHLNRRLVKRGDRVRQGQTIGTVGATGMATGPHLHYEFLVHGAHRDPRRVDLPEAEPLPETVLPEFRSMAAPLLARLEDIAPDQVLLASAEAPCRDAEDATC